MCDRSLCAQGAWQCARHQAVSVARCVNMYVSLCVCVCVHDRERSRVGAVYSGSLSAPTSMSARQPLHSPQAHAQQVQQQYAQQVHAQNGVQSLWPQVLPSSAMPLQHQQQQRLRQYDAQRVSKQSVRSSNPYALPTNESLLNIAYTLPSRASVIKTDPSVVKTESYSADTRTDWMAVKTEMAPRLQQIESTRNALMMMGFDVRQIRRYAACMCCDAA
jgi:hypothetical protein